MREETLLANGRGPLILHRTTAPETPTEAEVVSLASSEEVPQIPLKAQHAGAAGPTPAVPVAAAPLVAAPPPPAPPTRHVQLPQLLQKPGGLLAQPGQQPPLLGGLQFSAGMPLPPQLPVVQQPVNC